MARRAGWPAAFLTALGRSGSVSGAARAAGVDKGTVYLARKANPDFAAAWEAALADARVGLAGGDAPALARNEIVRASRAGRPCVMRVGPGRWSSEKEATFLRALEETANVKLAAETAGVSTAAVYARRARWPAFGEAWAAALERGYTDVELLLIANAKATLGGEAVPVGEGERLTAPITVADALNLLKLHRASVKGGAAQRYDWRAREPDIEQVRAEVLRKVAAMERVGVARRDGPD